MHWLYAMQKVWCRYKEFCDRSYTRFIKNADAKDIRKELSKMRNAMAEIHSGISDELYRKSKSETKDMKGKSYERR